MNKKLVRKINKELDLLKLKNADKLVRVAFRDITHSSSKRMDSDVIKVIIGRPAFALLFDKSSGQDHYTLSDITTYAITEFTGKTLLKSIKDNLKGYRKELERPSFEEINVINQRLKYIQFDSRKEFVESIFMGYLVSWTLTAVINGVSSPSVGSQYSDNLVRTILTTIKRNLTQAS